MEASVKTILKYINSFCIKFASFLLFALSVLMTANIILRYFFNTPIIWAEELTNYLFIWFGFLAGIYGVANHSHISVNAFTRFLPKKVKFSIQLLMNLIMLATCACFILPTINILPFLTLSSAMRIPEKYVYSILPISFCAFSYLTINNIYVQIKEFIEDQKAAGEEIQSAE